jgi:hypothetical protein
MARANLKRAALDLQKGKAPRGLDADSHRVRSASFVLPADQPFQVAKADDLRARVGVPHTGV